MERKKSENIAANQYLFNNNSNCLLNCQSILWSWMYPGNPLMSRIYWKLFYK